MRPEERDLSRRDVSSSGLGLGSVVAARSALAEYRYLAPVSVANPLASYPNRDWERIYRDIYRTDQRFTFLCCPNDTHNCLLYAQVKNNVVVRIEPTYVFQGARLYGNKVGALGPRCCQKGPVLAHASRRLRVNAPSPRFGDGRISFPAIPNGAARHDAARLGQLAVSHEEARLSRQACHRRTYSGTRQGAVGPGYDPEWSRRRKALAPAS
jgi:hypothetical protein